MTSAGIAIRSRGPQGPTGVGPAEGLGEDGVEVLDEVDEPFLKGLQRVGLLFAGPGGGSGAGNRSGSRTRKLLGPPRRFSEVRSSGQLPDPLARSSGGDYDPGMAADSLLAHALELPVAERARLVRVLSESIEEDRGALSQDEWLEAWGPIFSRRAAELEAGVAEPIDFRTALAGLRRARRTSR